MEIAYIGKDVMKYGIAHGKSSSMSSEESKPGCCAGCRNKGSKCSLDRVAAAVVSLKGPALLRHGMPMTISQHQHEQRAHLDYRKRGRRGYIKGKQKSDPPSHLTLVCPEMVS